MGDGEERIVRNDRKVNEDFRCRYEDRQKYGEAPPPVLQGVGSGGGGGRPRLAVSGQRRRKRTSHAHRKSH